MAQDDPQPPQWLIDMLATQSSQIAVLAERIEQMTNLRDSSERRTPDTTTQAEPDPHSSGPAQEIPKRPRPIQPDPLRFDGEDPALYPQFAGLLRAKIRIDGLALGEEEERVWYGFGRLKGEGAARIYPWMEYAQRTGNFTVEGLFEQMDIAFRDPRAREKAMAEINRTKQRGIPFKEFLNKFDRLLLEAEGWGWPDEIKKGYLKSAIAPAINQAMIAVEERTTYTEYCTQLRMVADRMDEVKERTSRFRRKWDPRTKEVQTTVSPPQESMDWEPTRGASAAQGKKPKRKNQVSKEEIERRRRSGCCFDCGGLGHLARDCPTGSIKHDKSHVHTSRTKTTESRVEEETTTSSESEDSGKE